jgi:hypothetical protein
MSPVRTRETPDIVDSFLVVIFLVGIYLEFGPRITASVPFPAAPSGIAGMIMLLRRRNWTDERQLFALMGVVTLYLLSTLCVTGIGDLKHRLTGFLQISYSLVIGYGLFITLIRYERQRLARIFFWFCVVIVIGCTLENYIPAFRNFSDAVRKQLFSAQVFYDANIRDEVLYGGVRPKLFTSEPSYVAYGLTLYAFTWYVLSTWQWKIIAYLALLGAGMFLIRSPTLVLGAALVAPYELLIVGRSVFGRTLSTDIKLMKLIVVMIAVVGAAAVGGSHFFGARVTQVKSSDDPSFFFREIGPALVAKHTLVNRPLAGAGLTGEESIAKQVMQVYVSSPAFSTDWRFDKIKETITNFFWLHWIYLGLLWGVIMLVALGAFMKALDAPSLLFCFIVWAVMGQSSGAYVSPKPWATLLIACAISILHFRQPQLVPQPLPRRVDEFMPRGGRVGSSARRPGYAR